MATNRRIQAARCQSHSRRALLSAGSLLAAALLCRSRSAAAQDSAQGAVTDGQKAVPPQFIGKWEGPWRLGMSSGHVELVLSDDPRTPSTIAVTNMAKFGAQPAPVDRIVRDGEKLVLRAYGADNRAMKVSMIVNAGDGSIEGFIVHDGFTNLCKLMRVP